ncbi:MAG: HIR complex subunit [Vezdaea acicularis]|nr:MAG: HIR complex subunit [Vezdaea acicularis]
MSYHSGTIHTVRFSSNGRYLASGADDKIVCVYTLDPNPPSHASSFGTNEPPPVENWRIFRRLIGHENDVQDLGWSYDSSILVSVGLDSKVVIWSGYTFEKLKTLSSHQSHVKGLAFDPANKYFATASDDRTIKIVRFTPPAPNATAHDQMNNFVVETTIQAPFTSSPLTTYFRRCSWAPDGLHIAAANAVNGPVSSVAIITRGTWDGDINLIGHEAPVEVCAFSPRLYGKDPPDTANQDNSGHSTQNLITVIACAGQDRALSIWQTSNPRPLLITQELAGKAISDLAWGPSGRHLFMTSLDGSVIALVFEEGDLGYVMGVGDIEQALVKYGGSRRGAAMVEGTESLLLEEKSRVGEIKGVEGRMGELMGDNSSNSVKVTVNGTSAQVNGSASHSAMEVDRDPARTQARANVPTTDPNVAKLERLKQRVTITKDGKKRIAPLLVTASAGAAESSLPNSQLMTTSDTPGSRNEGPQNILDMSLPFDGLPPGGLSGLLLGNKRKIAVNEGDSNGKVERQLDRASRSGATPVVVNGVDGLHPAQIQAQPHGQQPTPEFLRPAVVSASLTVAQIRLMVPKVRSLILRNHDSYGNPAITTEVDGTPLAQPVPVDTVLEVKNPTGVASTGRPQDRDPTRISVTRRGQSLWQDFLPKSVLLVTGTQDMWAAACEDGTLHIWTPAGRRLINAMVLDAQPVILESKGPWLLCVTAVGMCHVWNVKAFSSPHPPISLGPILEIATHTLGALPTGAPALTSARLNSKGHIIATLSNGDGYTYSPAMYAWQRLSEVWWAVGSQYWNSTDSSVGAVQSLDQQNGTLSRERDLVNVSAGIIPHLERRTTTECLVKGRAYYLQRLVKSLLSREGYEGFESAISVGHLENRLAAALELEAKEEFRLYLQMYAKRLGAEGLKSKVEELLKSLLGGIFRDTNATNGESDQSQKETSQLGAERGWDGNRKHRDLQRITVPYAKVLGVLDDHGVDTDEPMTL